MSSPSNPKRTAILTAGQYVRLSVSDTGSGMAPETLLRATEPFYTTKDIGKGTGLGLSMVYGLAAQSGGMLMLESTPGHGTTATIWLPVDQTVAPLPEPIASRRTPTHPRPCPFYWWTTTNWYVSPPVKC